MVKKGCLGGLKAAKPEYGGRTEQRSASDLSTQATQLLLSSSPKTDKELSLYESLTSNLSAIPEIKHLIINHLYPQNTSGPVSPVWMVELLKQACSAVVLDPPYSQEDQTNAQKQMKFAND